MTRASNMCYVWLYTSNAMQATKQIAGALSIPRARTLAGNDSQAVAADVHYLSQSAMVYFPLKGDFELSCDVRLAGWALADVQAALQQLSATGLRIAMADDTNDSPFAFLLFDAGSCRPVTVVESDETNEVFVYPAAASS